MRVSVAAIILLTLVPAAAFAAVSTFIIHPGDGQSVVFTSRAPMETFEGKTNQVSGTITADLANLADSCQVRIAVDLASISTGIGLRDRHMRERHLETDDYPSAIFTGIRIIDAQPRSLAPGGTARITAAGTFEIHGVARPLTLPVDLALSTDGRLSISAEFEVLLPDHDIKRPKVLFVKLAEDQDVRIDLVATPMAKESR